MLILACGWWLAVCGLRLVVCGLWLVACRIIGLGYVSVVFHDSICLNSVSNIGISDLRYLVCLAAHGLGEATAPT